MARRMYGNESVAYDFDLFLPAEKRAPKKDNIKKMPMEKIKTEKKVKEAKKAATSRISMVLVSTLMLGMVCGMIFSRVQMTEVRDQINKAQKELEIVERESVRLNMLIENKATYQNLEQEAAALGMQKPSAGQIKYISINGQDKVEIHNDSEGKLFAFAK